MKLLQNKKYIALYILAVFILIVFIYSYAAASGNTYPTEEWQISTPEEQGMRFQMLAEMMEHIKKNSFNIDSLLIVRNGYVEEQVRLDALVNSAAKAIGFTWASKKEGMAEIGVFRRTVSPSFKFEYPKGSKKAAIKHSGEVMRMKTPGNDLFSASVVDIPIGMKLADFGPKHYVQKFENYDKNVKVVSNKEITLKCGTKAYQTNFTWLWNNTVPITTFLVSAYKDSKCIFLWADTWKYHDKVEPIVQSLTFK